MKRMRQQGSSAGWWLTDDNRFYICRLTRLPGGKRPGWMLGSSFPSGRQWLKEQALWTATFPTRREAITRLQDALALNPIVFEENCGSPRVVYELQDLQDLPLRQLLTTRPLSEIPPFPCTPSEHMRLFTN